MALKRLGLHLRFAQHNLAPLQDTRTDVCVGLRNVIAPPLGHKAYLRSAEDANGDGIRCLAVDPLFFLHQGGVEDGSRLCSHQREVAGDNTLTGRAMEIEDSPQDVLHFTLELARNGPQQILPSSSCPADDQDVREVARKGVEERAGTPGCWLECFDVFPRQHSPSSGDRLWL